MISDEEILKYYPLIKSLANYFASKNSNVEIDDLVQEAWLGFLQGLKRYDPSKNVSLGAALKQWAFGRVYRSLLGNKNVIFTRKMNQMNLHEKIYDCKDFFKEIDNNDLIDNIFNDEQKSIIKLLSQGYKKTDICKINNIDSNAYDRLIQEIIEIVI